MRTAHGSDFNVDVEKLGRFTFGRRKMRDQYAIRSEYNRLTNGNYLDNVPADLGAWAIATIAVLLVAAPDGFSVDPDSIDPLTQDANSWEDTVADVYAALRKQELSFRPDSPQKVQTAGP